MKSPTIATALLAALLPFAPVSCLESPAANAEPIWWGGNHYDWIGTNPIHAFEPPTAQLFYLAPNGWNFDVGDPGQVGASIDWPFGVPTGVLAVFQYRGSEFDPWIEVALAHQSSQGTTQFYFAEFVFEAAPNHWSEAQGWLFFDGFAEVYVDFQAVPEPGMVGLLAVGALAALRRRRT